jgi:hypothetical protein
VDSAVGTGGAAPVKVLYVAGSGRSGSTILDRILGQLDGFFSAGELCNLWARGLLARRRCGCGMPVPDCPVWGAVLAEAFGGPDQVDAGRLAAATQRQLHVRSVPRMLLGRAQGAAGAEYQAALTRLYRAVARQTGCRVIVDSSKSPVYAGLVAAIPGVEVSVVHLVRDPRATAWSFLRKKRLPDFGDDRLMQRQHPAVSARRWSLWQAVTELLWRRPGRYLRLRYEDFVADPQAAVRAVVELTGETPAAWPFTGPATVRLGATHSVSGNPNRFGTGEVELRADEEWRRAMRVADRAMVTALTWPLLLRYRYPLRRPRG